MPLSTATPERLPEIEALRRLTKSIAMLDAIICPEWDSRYYSYDSKWGQDEELASMRNDRGDEWFILFDRQGAALKGLAHEHPLAGGASFAAQIQETVPPAFGSFLREPAFGMDEATFCIWRGHDDAAWNVVSPANRSVSSVEDGSARLIGILDGEPETYRAWAEAYYERAISLAAVKAIYEHEALSKSLVGMLNAEITLAELSADGLEIGYPAARGRAG